MIKQMMFREYERLFLSTSVSLSFIPLAVLILPCSQLQLHLPSHYINLANILPYMHCKIKTENMTSFWTHVILCISLEQDAFLKQ